jgi:DNA (cytosine-5)-methyltransferase 1
MMRPLALDLFCGAGGASMGLHRAGFDVVGVDIKRQPRYPFTFVQGDALNPPLDLSRFDLIWASPPCQPFTALRSMVDVSGYEDLIDATRALLAPHPTTVIENVPGAPLRKDLTLCANSFGLRAYRHRIFELSFWAWQPGHPPHRVQVNRRKLNRRKHWDAGGFATVVGDIAAYVGPEAMGIDWMTGDELSEAIPPAYAELIGRAAMAHLAAASLEAAA